MQADVSDPAHASRLFATAASAFGGVDVLIAVAGIMQLATIADSDDALFDRHVAVIQRPDAAGQRRHHLSRAGGRPGEGRRHCAADPATVLVCNAPSAGAGRRPIPSARGQSCALEGAVVQEVYQRRHANGARSTVAWTPWVWATK